MVTEAISEKFSDLFSGFELGPVTMVQDKKIKPPKQPKRARPRIWLPYKGPPLHEIWLTKHVHFDRARTTAKLVRKCSRCDYEQYEINGIEELAGKWDPTRADICYTHIRRKPGKGIFVHSADLQGADVFGVHHFGWVFCTDRFKQFVEAANMTNIAFSEMGDVV